MFDTFSIKLSKYGRSAQKTVTLLNKQEVLKSDLKCVLSIKSRQVKALRLSILDYQ